MKNTIIISVSVICAGFFMWLATKGTPFSQIKDVFIKADYAWVAVAAFFAVLAYFFRAWRWNLLFEPMGYKTKNSNAFWAVSFGYFMNYAIPRSGELARATALLGTENIPVEKSFGTIILERVVDLVFMFIFLGITAMLKFEALKSIWVKFKNSIGGNTYTDTGFNLKWLILGLGFLALVAYFALRNHPKVKQSAIYQKIIALVANLLEGLKSIFKLKQKGKFILYSCGIWGSYYLAAYLICFALPETQHFTWADGCLIIATGTLGMMVPSSGGAGTFHTAITLGISGLFMSQGKDPELGSQIGLALAFLSHSTQSVVTFILGGIAIPMLAIARKKNKPEPQTLVQA
jgi:glycosyltransferase 2 family protein